MIPFLGLAKLFSNPLTKYLGEKAIGYFEHKSEMLKNERIAEIELSKVSSNTTNQIIREKSWKDEYLTIVFTCILVAHFIPQSMPFMAQGWQLLKVSTIRILVGYINNRIRFIWYEYYG
jgi:hypothetical protein